MWLLTTRGFYSVVLHREDPLLLLVRSREESDLLALRDLAPGIEPCYDPDADYPWGAEVPREEWSFVMSSLAREIDYPSFKDPLRELGT